MIIDAHAHKMGDLNDVSKIIEIMDEYHIDKILLCPGPKNNTEYDSMFNKTGYIIYKLMIFLNKWVVPYKVKRLPCYTYNVINNSIRLGSRKYILDREASGEDGNESVYRFIEAVRQEDDKRGGRIKQVYWINPNKPDFQKKMEKEFKEWHFRALKLHQAFYTFPLNSNEMTQILEFAHMNKLVLFIHLMSNTELEHIIKRAQDYPEVNFVLLHLIGLEKYIKDFIKRDNIYYETSPYTYTDEKRILKAIGYLGAHHVVFGSDSPIDEELPGKNLSRLQEMNIPYENLGLILGENMESLLSK